MRQLLAFILFIIIGFSGAAKADIAPYTPAPSTVVAGSFWNWLVNDWFTPSASITAAPTPISSSGSTVPNAGEPPALTPAQQKEQIKAFLQANYCSRIIDTNVTAQASRKTSCESFLDTCADDISATSFGSEIPNTYACLQIKVMALPPKDMLPTPCTTAQLDYLIDLEKSIIKAYASLNITDDQCKQLDDRKKMVSDLILKCNNAGRPSPL